MGTEQEEFWAGEFGDEYTMRNTGKHWIASNLAFFGEALARTRGVGSILELGANLGLNLLAIRQLLPTAVLSAVEINARAAAELRRNVPEAAVEVGSIEKFTLPGPWDLVLAKGVLIHVNPSSLPVVYARMVKASNRYILVVEYYNPVPVAIPYRGHSDRLFKRDFAGEMMAAHGLTLVDYGFRYHGDPNFPQDDLTWFLLEKR